MHERQPDPRAAYALRPLSWIAEEVIYDPDSRTLHRPNCPLVHRAQAASHLPAGSALELVWAPRVCDCQPDVTLALGRS